MAGIIHDVGSFDFDNYYYYRIVIPNGISPTINGITIPSMAAPLTFDVTVTSASGSGFFLVGKKKPELMADYNSDGTVSIR